MDNASDYESGDCGFESRHGQYFFLVFFFNPEHGHGEKYGHWGPYSRNLWQAPTCETSLPLKHRRNRAWSNKNRRNEGRATDLFRCRFQWKETRWNGTEIIVILVNSITKMWRLVDLNFCSHLLPKVATAPTSREISSLWPRKWH